VSELEGIIAAYDALRNQGIPSVLATVVHVEGSAFRQAGARMLISAEGRMTGAISGGCLEGDALKKALLALHQVQNKLVTYDTNDEEDAVLGAQLGCNGIIQVLFEPLDYSKADNPVELLRRVVQSTEATVLVVRFRLKKKAEQVGTKIVLSSSVELLSGSYESRQAGIIEAGARRAIELQQSRFEIWFEEEEEQVFYNLLVPPPQLVLIGAGNDAQRLAELAGILGWRVTVVDGRASHANPQRFAGGCQLIIGKPEQVADQLPMGRQTAVVLMTHNFPYDVALFRCLLPRMGELRYLGIMGPRKRFERMLEELEEKSKVIAASQLDRIYAPVGLDLGAEQPSEIALAILAEVMACFNEAEGGSLRAKKGPIHDRRSNHFEIKQG